MTTAEPVISSALLQSKSYDVLHCVKAKHGFIGSTDVSEPLRFRLCRIEGADKHKDVKVEVALYSLGERLAMPLCSSHASNNTWDEWIFFPIEIADVPLDALICCTVSSVSGVVGGTSFYPFTSRGELKFGTRRYKVHVGVPADGSETSKTLGHIPTPEGELLSRDHALDRMRKVDWLDPLAQAKVASITQERCVEQGVVVLTVELPTSSSKLPIFHLSVPMDYDKGAALFDQRPGPFVPFYDVEIHAENLAEAQAGILSKSLHLIADADAQPAYRQRKQLEAIVNRAPIQIEGFRVDDASLMWQFRYFLSRNPKGFVPFMQCVDWDNRAERSEAEQLIRLWKPIPVEDTLVLLSATFRSIKPLRDYAISILQTETSDRLRLILLQLVQALRYDVEDELVEFLLDRCVSNWELCCNFYWYVSVEADLEGKSPNNASVKLWSRIEEEVGGRYTHIKQSLLDALLTENIRFHQQLQKQEQLRAVLNNLYTTVAKEKDRTKKMEIVKRAIDEGACGIKELFSPQSLRGGEVLLPSHPNIACYGISSKGLYMFKSAKMPIKVPFITVREQVAADGEKDGAAASPTLEVPDASDYLGNRPSDDAVAADTPVDFAAAHGVGGGTPASPDLGASGAGSINSSPNNVLATDTPTLAAAGTSGGGNASSSFAMVPSILGSSSYIKAPGESFSVMFKSGDDVRQDQLVIQFIELMDSLLKSNGLDLCLTPYKVLATSQSDGFVEIVPNVDTYQNVQKESVSKYIQRHNATPAEYQRAMDRFVKSCAGYCVITYLLGIGDRHLENLLITTDGRLLHIDFGFIFGYDPKPFPPPMKINKEMVDAIGGINSSKYRQFKTYCCSAFNILRKHSALILQLLLLMIDASIPHISGDGSVDPRLGIIKVQDKLRLDLNDAEATQHIQNVIADSVGALFTNLWDVIHEAAQAVRT